jgi:hypothetical protein
MRTELTEAVQDRTLDQEHHKGIYKYQHTLTQIVWIFEKENRFLRMKDRKKERKKERERERKRRKNIDRKYKGRETETQKPSWYAFNKSEIVFPASCSSFVLARKLLVISFNFFLAEMEVVFISLISLQVFSQIGREENKLKDFQKDNTFESSLLKEFEENN